MRINIIHKDKVCFEDLTIGDVFYHKDLREICIKIEDVFDEYDDCYNTVLLSNGVSNGELCITDDNDEVILCDAELSAKY